ncbi:MAG: peptidase M20 [Acetobacteraceae bacterium SCN 69-10]|nr:MAG: peptidase M20 [Acetobacteraceae bacterium SCN 69-10]OJY68474.1 MAG: peptidase M20 [Rhodospirillales bacterium 70-18]
MSAERVEAWLAANRQRLLDELFELLRAPSVSTDPAYAAGLARAAEILAERLRRIGMRDVQMLDGGGNPAVFAQWCGAPGAPTILVYGHYDVQPPDPLELWTTPPFEPTLSADGATYSARGASDDKSPLWIAISGIEGWLAVTGGLPLNVKVLLEGEEEVGSRSIPAILDKYRDLLAADVLVSADGGRWRPGVPSVNTNSRGNVGMEVTVRTAGHDLHSGRYGGPVANAAMVLARLLATLHDEHNRIAVPGFFDGLRRPGNADYASMQALGFDEAKFFAEIGARPGAIEPGLPEGSVGLLESLWFRPTLEMNGITGGYQGPGGKTVIPCQASAKLTCRLGPGQLPAKVAAAVEAHLRARCPAWADLSVAHGRGSSAAYAVPEDDPFLEAIERVMQQVHGRRPLRVGIGGTLPISSMVKQALGLETVMLSYAIADENIHAPNEFFRLSSFDDGLRAWARALPELAAVRR